MVASLASKIGSWRPVVAAAWLMTSLTASAALIALLQTASAAPLSSSRCRLARSHVLDRRRIVLASQMLQLLVAAALGLLTLGHVTTPVNLARHDICLGRRFSGGSASLGCDHCGNRPARAAAVANVAELGGGHRFASGRTGVG
jgi:Transmembrane secretion effector